MGLFSFLKSKSKRAQELDDRIAWLQRVRDGKEYTAQLSGAQAVSELAKLTAKRAKIVV